MKIRINGKPKRIEDVCGKERCTCEATESRMTHSKALLSIAKEMNNQKDGV